jgi:hypothetical protein
MLVCANPDRPWIAPVNVDRRSLRDTRKFIDGIQASLAQFPRVEPEQTADQVDSCIRTKQNRQMGFLALYDGVVVAYNSRESLDDRSHRFIFTDDGSAKYHRESFNIDVQMLTPPELNLDGALAIATEAKAIEELGFVYTMLRGMQSADWARLERTTVPTARC